MMAKRSVFVIIVVTALLVSMVGMASADRQYWYFTDTTTVPSPGNYEMHKDSGDGTTKPMLHGTSRTWVADQAAQVDVDMSGTWDVELKIETDAVNKPVDFYANIGWIDTGTSTFHTKASTHFSESGSPPKIRTLQDTIDTTSYSIDKDDYLAIEIDNTGGGETFHIWTDPGVGDNSPSFVHSPTGDPGYPVPELSTILLTSMGMLLLCGFVVYSRRRNNK